jgi:hypothetical protein
MASTPTTVGALSAKVMLDRVFSYKNRIRNPLIDSGFLNTENYFVRPEAGGLHYESKHLGGEIVGCVRGYPATAIALSSFDNIDISTWAYQGETVAYTPVMKILSVLSGTNQGNAVGQMIKFTDIVGDGGCILDTELNMLKLNSAIHAHFVGLEEVILFEIMQLIDSSITLKRDNDGENPFGVPKTYAQDVTAIRPILSQTTDLKDTAVTEVTKQLNLRREISAAVTGMDVSISKVLFALLPKTAFDSYRRHLDPVIRGQYLYKGVTETDGSTPSYGSNFFTDGNIVYVGIPDNCFKLNGTKYRCYIMPSSALAVFHPMVPVYQSVHFGGNVMFADVNIQQRIAAAGIGLTPNHFNMARDRLTSDPILEAVAATTGGRLDAFNTNTIRIFMTQNLLTQVNALAVALQMQTHLSVLRTQPQFIQEWQIDPTLL